MCAFDKLVFCGISFAGCHVKVHKDHFDKQEDFIGYCKGNITTFVPIVFVFINFLWIDAKFTCISAIYIVISVVCCSELRCEDSQRVTDSSCFL